MGFSGLSRVFHWGPMVALGIIKWVTLITLYCNTMLWPPAESLYGLVFTATFLGFSSLTLFHFFCSLSTGPGFLPAGWTPPAASAASQLQWCSVCQGCKAPRSHHCRKCGRCVMKMDHHCPWINSCVGHHNQGHFIAFLASAVCGCMMSSISLSMSLYYGLNRTWYLYYGTGREPQVVLTVWTLLGALFGLGLALGVVIAVGLLLVFQLKSVLRNQTGIEDWIREKADYRHRNTDTKFIWPYNLGRMANLQQVVTWSCVPVGDGITWEVVEGTDQYTLTREQLKQKEDKRERTREYQIIMNYGGAWFPLSQGVAVCCHPPCTDEPRIALQTGCVVRVTRWKKYWLYGEKVQEEGKEMPTGRVRGWFPRHCAVERLDHADTCVLARQEGKKVK
eukprot:GFUD01026050.1.p1 GENE.GFUD01026050.1~~GFUD01026050.1.p1  ORF type:complete len:392 (-),score=118.92 GFUD01026050.1:316-1491(-)